MLWFSAGYLAWKYGKGRQHQQVLTLQLGWLSQDLLDETMDFKSDTYQLSVL